MGGEPFLLDWMPSFLREATDKGIRVNISTNGSFPDALLRCSGVNPDMLTIGVSLEGSSSELHNLLTGSLNFDKVLISIRQLVLLGLKPVVKTVVSRQNMADIPAVVELLKTLGVTRYYLIHRDLLSTDPAALKDSLSYVAFLRFYRDLAAVTTGIDIYRVNASCFEKQTLPAGARCAAGVRKLAVMPDGSAYPCNLFQHIPEFRLGNIFEDDFPILWSHSALAAFRHGSANSCNTPHCPNFAHCTGGCPAHGYFHTRRLHGRDIRCS